MHPEKSYLEIYSTFNISSTPTTDQLTEEALKTSLKFFIVRHPLQRLLSSYIDQITNPDVLPVEFQRLQKYIVTYYRSQDDVLSQPTFPEFVNFVINQTKNLEFFQWNRVLGWYPYYYKCRPCDITYDAIIKYENILEEEKYITDKKEFNNIVDTSYSPNSISRQEEIFYSQLTKSEILNLHKIYLIDFEMFSYNLEPYLTYAIS